jgi:hypothetical protein
MTARYTFVVCARCGVQSPAIVLTGASDRGLTAVVAKISETLGRMGWRIDKLKFTSISTCPACLDGEKKDSDNAA